ncbi:hypothetical protein [Cryobacterium sp. CG_9.6]|uniref:hypothetical protein n=1 Tax=Cryobacterium sp. CG_9.6 TaxID=2760710 RepID=UPI0024757F87|nr:hypothetical protein [Cryobacterium sp. CG_9.6]MDH6238469.1 hypothetical protein [Cryobacterium sp. CG_9.6]
MTRSEDRYVASWSVLRKGVRVDVYVHDDLLHKSLAVVYASDEEVILVQSNPAWGKLHYVRDARKDIELERT